MGDSTLLMQNSASCLPLACAQRIRRRRHSLERLMPGKDITNSKNPLTGRLSSVICSINKNTGFTSENFPHVEKTYLEFHYFASNNIGRQLKALDSYFDKLPGGSDKASSQTNFDAGHAEREYKTDTKAGHSAEDGSNTRKELGSLENYFNKLNRHGNSRRNSMEAVKYDDTSEANSTSKMAIFSKDRSREKELVDDLNPFASNGDYSDNKDLSIYEENNTEGLSSYDESSDFSLINLIASINIAVFLFEIASPVRDSNFEQLSLPLLYGAKVNSLILDGEWWRLVTPMFLHSGLLHVALSCWVLLTFGPQVCRGYGPFTFLLIYVLGGICANVTSFIHTSEIAVCGTGPIFALIGAWLVYQFQNKDSISKAVSEDMYRKAVIATALSFLLGYTGPTDEWTHLSAAISGLIYGFFTCPILLLNNMPPDNQKEGVALLRGHANPWKSLLTFLIFMFALCPLVFMFGPNPDMFQIDNFLVV